MSDHDAETKADSGDSPGDAPEAALYARVKAAFIKASEMGIAERDEYIRREFGDDLDAESMLRGLLSAADRPLPYETLADEIIVAHRAQRIGTKPGSDPGDDSGRPKVPERSRIGPYLLLERLGEGGFGVVYLAEQHKPVKRRVAIKVLKPGMDTRQVIARFEAERHALAMMEHPGIARVFDGGETETGRPYFVMELVRGEPITEYCDRRELSINERLRLFGKVCGALHHAHMKGVIHRDIKPSNVLVTEIDGEATPKVIDFGIAKATNARLTDQTLHTDLWQMLGTPEYMSPEQAELSANELDSRADVYSLGVLLYELLTGITPFESTRLRSAALAEMQRIIRNEDPQRPSTKLSTSRTGDAAAKSRGIAKNKLRAMLTGDLDWVVMRCLEKQVQRRYDSAAEIGREIDRFLSGQPVDAVPPSRLYLAGKYIRRHRRTAVAAALVLTALLMGLIGTTAGLIDATHQRRIAQAEADRAERQTYVAQMQLAWSSLGDKPGKTAAFLEDAPEEHRGWEWAAINARLDLSTKSIDLPGLPLSGPNGPTQFGIAPIDQDTVLVARDSDPVGAELRSLSTGEILFSIDGFGPNAKHHYSLSPDRSRCFVYTLPRRRNRAPPTDLELGAFRLQILDPRTGELLETLAARLPEDVAHFCLGRFGRRVYYAMGNRIVGHEIRTDTAVAESEELPFPAITFTVSPDGHSLVATGSQGGVAVLDSASLRVRHLLQGHRNLVRFSQFSADGSTLITASLDGTARIWNLDRPADDPVVLEHGIAVVRAYLDEDGTTAFTETDAIRAWDAKTRELKGVFASESLMNGSTFVPYGGQGIAAIGDDGTLRIWDPDVESTIRLNGHRGHINAARFTGDSGFIVSGGWDGWGSDAGGAIRLWDADTGLHVAALGLPGEVGRFVDVSGDGRYALTATSHGKTKGLRIIDLERGDVEYSREEVWGLAAHPSQHLAAVVFGDTLHTLDLDTGVRKPVSDLDLRTYQGGMFWTPDGTLFVTAVRPGVLGIGWAIAIYHGHDFTLLGSVSGTAAAFDHTEGLLVVVDAQASTLRWIDPMTLEEQRSLVVPDLDTPGVRIVTNGNRYILTSPNEKAIMFWDRETATRVAVFTGDGFISDLTWDETGDRLLVTWGRSIHLFDHASCGQRAQARRQLQSALDGQTDANIPEAVSNRAELIKSLRNTIEGQRATLTRPNLQSP
jgi:serine/threonine protein kinase/WD40 repeat protein